MGSSKSKPFVDVSATVLNKYKGAAVDAVKHVERSSIGEINVAATRLSSPGVTQTPVTNSYPTQPPHIPSIAISEEASKMNISSLDLDSTPVEAQVETSSQLQERNLDKERADFHAPMDPAILAEISKWSKVSTSLAQKVVDPTKERMASAIRFEEEQDLQSRGIDGVKVTTMPGRLNEAQIREVFTRIRDQPEIYTPQKIAEKFRIPVETAIVIAATCRMPFFELGDEDNLVKFAM